MAKFVVFCILILLEMILITAVEDSLYTCSGWNKLCLKERSDSADLKIVSGQYFNCYSGYLPTCAEFLPSEEDSQTKFCKNLNSDSEYNSELKVCQVEAEKVDDDADHFSLVWNNYS